MSRFFVASGAAPVGLVPPVGGPKDKRYEIASLVRTAMERTLKVKTMRNRCLPACLVMRALFISAGYEADISWGYVLKRRPRSHAWITSGDKTFDVTLTQFFRKAPRVFVGSLAPEHLDVRLLEVPEESVVDQSTGYMLKTADRIMTAAREILSSEVKA